MYFVLPENTVHNSYVLNHCAHIDQLTRIMSLVGTPSEALLAKITSDEVSGGHLGTSQRFMFLMKVTVRIQLHVTLSDKFMIKLKRKSWFWGYAPKRDNKN